MNTKFEKDFLLEVVNRLQHIYGNDMEVSAVMCWVNGLELTGVVGRVPGRRIVPVVYLEDIPARASAEKAAYIIARKIHAMLTDKTIKPVRNSQGSERQAILADVVLQAAGRKANRLMLRDNAHISHGDVVGLFYLYSRKTCLTKEEMGELGIDQDEMLGAACKNTLSKFGITLANMSEFAHSLPADTILQSEPFTSVKFDPQSLYLLTNDAPTGGAALILMPPVLETLGRMAGGDYYIVPMSTQEVVIASTESMYSPKILADLLHSENLGAKEKQAETILSDYIFRYEHETKRLMTIQQSG